MNPKHICVSHAFGKVSKKKCNIIHGLNKDLVSKFSVRILYTGFRISHSNFYQLRLQAGSCYPSKRRRFGTKRAIAQAKNREQSVSDRERTLPTSLRDNVTSEFAENNW